MEGFSINAGNQRAYRKYFADALFFDMIFDVFRGCGEGIFYRSLVLGDL